MLRGNAKFRIQSKINAAISTLISLAIVAAHFFKGNCFLEAGLEVSATRFSRIEPGQVG